MTNPAGESHARETTRTVAISGASGLIGSALAEHLAQRGGVVKRLVRRPARNASEISWDPGREMIDTSALEGVDAIVNLAGESLATRWTPELKRRIRDSRVKGTTLLARAINSLGSKPRVLLSGSAVGIYGDRGDETLDESSALGDDFLATVCREWEGAASAVEKSGVRVVHLRTGIVLGKQGGALARMLPPFRMGVGGKLGSGRQWMSWIALADVVSAIAFLMDSPVTGAVNLTSPNPVTNEEFTHSLASELHRPSMFTVPRFALKALFGEMSDAALLASQRVMPRRLLEAKFAFASPTLQQALAGILS